MCECHKLCFSKTAKSVVLHNHSTSATPNSFSSGVKTASLLASCLKMNLQLQFQLRFFTTSQQEFEVAVCSWKSQREHLLPDAFFCSFLTDHQFHPDCLP